MGSGRALRAVARVLAVALALTGALPVGAGFAERPARVPVVLVHGLTCGGPQVWGERQAGSRGLYARLLEAGFVPGRTLFNFDYDNAAEADYAGLAEVGLDRVVREALACSGSDRVDLVTFGTGALVARYWAATRPAAGAPLRNLVMIASPNHGQFQADFLKVLYHTERLVGCGAADSAGVAGRPGESASSGTSRGPAFPDPPAFSNEDQYVAERAQDYQALYGTYVLETRLLAAAGAPGDGSGPAASGEATPPPAYDPWLLQEHAALVDEFIYQAQEIPGRSALGLTQAYYELLSLRVGRQLFLASTAAGGKWPDAPQLENLLDGGWKGQLLGYLKALLVEWGIPAARRLWAEHRAGVGLGLGEMLTLLEPAGPAMSRLVPVYLAFPGPGATPSDTARLVLCNSFLGAWEVREAERRPAGTRYVVIAGACPSPLGLVGYEVGPNDMTVEAASAVTSPALPDSFRLEKGLQWAHGLIPGNARLASLVLAIIDGRDAGAAASTTGTARLWQPAYRPVRFEAGSAAGALAGSPAGAPITVEVKVADPELAGLPGLTAAAWLAEAPAGVNGGVPAAAGLFEFRPDPASPEGLSLVGSLTVPRPAPGRELLLGVRLLPAGPPGRAFLVMGRYLGRDPGVPFSYTVSVSPAAQRSAGGELAEAAPDGAPNGAADEATGAAPDGAANGAEEGAEDGSGRDGESRPADKPGVGPEPGTGNPAGPDGEAGEPGRAEIVPTPDPPLIHVVRVTKLTTDKRERRTYHTEWQWDFGDGERLQDADPQHTSVTVEHTYAAPGTYRVAAVSLANDGRVLRDLEWTVEVTAGGQTERFEAETILEPAVTLTLEGPRRWVTGKPARYDLKAGVSWPPRTRRQVIQAYPGWSFDVVWEKPGWFEVRAAVTVRQSYEFPDGQRITIYNTYLTTVNVELFTPGLTE